MANPIFIPAVFAETGVKNPIQKTLQPNQQPQEATWEKGWGNVTFIPIDSGGKAPLGQDFNGVLNAITSNVVHTQNGKRYKWSQEVVDNYGGYSFGDIVQSDDGLKEFRSILDNNTYNPNINPTNSWIVYSGVGSIPVATSTVAGVTKVLNTLNSTDVASALSAAQGKELLDWLDVIMYSPIPYPSTTIPQGFIPMDGRTLTAAQYPKLFALYGATLPDMSDEFIRGKSASRSILSRQSDELKSHSHQIPDTDLAVGVGNLIENDGGSKSSRNIQTYSTGGTETRPRNIAFLYIVKAG